MDKSGQVFLIAAVILALALFSVSVVYNSISVSPPLVEYRRLSENYLIEYPKVVNFARFYDADEASAISGFNNVFLGFARQKEPNFGVFYTFKDSRGNINIVNTLNKKVLHIEVVDGNRDVRLGFDLVSSNTGTSGSICVDGVGCNSVNSDVSDYGGRYSNVQGISNIQDGDKLRVTDTTTRNSAEFDISSFTSTVLTRSDNEHSERKSLDERGSDATVIEVSIQEYD